MGLLVAVVVLGIAEGVCRWIAPQIPRWNIDSSKGVLLTGHPTRLWSMSPGRIDNVGSTAVISENGLRGEMPEGPKGEGERRILVIGDSSWFGHGIGDAETVPAQLQRGYTTDREEGEGRKVTVINGATPGYSTEQSRMMLEEIGWDLEPDLLLIGSLWSDNNADKFRDVDLLRSAALGGSPLGWSALYQVMVAAVDRAKGGDGARVINWTRYSRFPKEQVRRVSLQRYAENLSWMITEAAERGIGAMLIAPCNAVMVEEPPDPGASWIPYFAAQKAVAEWYGVPYADTLPAMKKPGAGTRLFVDSMHPNPRGAYIFASVARRALDEAGWPENPLLGGAEAPFPAEKLVDTGMATMNRGTIPITPQNHLFTAAETVVQPPGQGR